MIVVQQMICVMTQLSLFFNFFIIPSTFHIRCLTTLYGSMGMKGKDSENKIQVVEVKCPKCGFNQIKYIPKEEIGKCPECNTGMIIFEILEEGKSY